MAEIHLQPPDLFDFKIPDDWPRWRGHFKQFCVTSRFKELSASKQVNTLLYCLDAETKSVLTLANVTEDKQKDYTLLLGKFNSFFQVHRNVIF